jgi:hypothetical protein
MSVSAKFGVCRKIILLVFLFSCFTPIKSAHSLVANSIDLASYQADRNGIWFSEDLSSFPETALQPQAHFQIRTTPFNNRKNGQISSKLLAGYFFIQWDISSSFFDQYAHTIQAVFLKSALMSFVDYPNNKVLDWWRRSSYIPTDVIGIIRSCKQKEIPVFLFINYSDYIPGPIGTGTSSLQPADNIANTLVFLQTLENQGIQVDGITFGNEIEDESGFGAFKPTVFNCDLIGKYIDYAKAVKTQFPEVKIYAFDSSIMAARGKLWAYWDYFSRMREAELLEGKVLLDGFIFTESYVYQDSSRQLRDSQLIMDDTESLYRDTPVYRYDYDGSTHPDPDRAYLVEVLQKTKDIFGRDLEIGITEYLPAIPYQFGETNTSCYHDFDFIVHFADVVGIYAEQGLDVVAKMMFGDHLEHHKAYFDRSGNLGPNFPVHLQLAQHFRGEILEVVRSRSHDSLKVKVYAARHGNKYFIFVLNKEMRRLAAVRLTLSPVLDITARLPGRSYTSFLVDSTTVTVCGIGQGEHSIDAPSPKLIQAVPLLLLND